jgi:hypothetical protein
MMEGLDAPKTSLDNLSEPPLPTIAFGRIHFDNANFSHPPSQALRPVTLHALFPLDDKDLKIFAIQPVAFSLGSLSGKVAYLHENSAFTPRSQMVLCPKMLRFGKCKYRKCTNAHTKNR